MAIKRRDVVTRHNPKITKINPFYPLSVSNGEFAYTAILPVCRHFLGICRRYAHMYTIPLGLAY